MRLVPWTKRSLHPSLKLITIAAWWRFDHIPLSKDRKYLMFWRPLAQIPWHIEYLKKNQTLLSFVREADTTGLSIPNIRLQCLIFIYLFSYCIKRWLCPDFYDLPNLKCICIVLREASVSVTSFTYTREINGFQWKRILVLFFFK